MAFSEQTTLVFGLCCETAMHLDVEVEAAHAECEARCVSPSCFSLFVLFCIYDVNIVGAFRVRNVPPDTPATTPVSIMHSLITLHLKHVHLLEDHDADCAVLCQHKLQPTDAQAHKMDGCATADALRQAICTAEDCMTRAEHTAALAEQDVRFLKALNVHSPLDCLASLSSEKLIILHKQTSYMSEEAVQAQVT